MNTVQKNSKNHKFIYHTYSHNHHQINLRMSDYLSSEEIDSKLSLVIRKPQEGKTFICISNIVNDKKRNVHIVLTMNTLSAGMQFFGRMEEEVGPKRIIVFNSKKETAGDCFYARNEGDVYALLIGNPDIKVVVCCAHDMRIRKSIIQLINMASDSMSFISSRRNFVIHIDEGHKYIPENRESIKTYNASPIVIDIIGYSGTPNKIWINNWCRTQTDDIFHKILIRDIEEELNISRSPEYFGVHRCDFDILEERMSSDALIETSQLDPNISQTVLSRAGMTEKGRKTWYDTSFHFDLGNEHLLLTYIDYIIPQMHIDPNVFSYHFVPAYTRKASQYQTIDILLKHYPNANVISINGNGTDLYRIRQSDNRSIRVKSGDVLLQISSPEERKRLGEPSKMIQELIKEYPNCPTFVTGFTCVGMSVTLINGDLGNFDSVVMAHQHYSRDKLYQLCRFLFNYTSWSSEAKSRIKTTKFYSLTKSVVDTCLEYEESVERMCTDFAGKTCSLREIQGLDPEEPTVRELKKSELKSIKLVYDPTNETKKLFKKHKVYEGNDRDQWAKAEKFYEDIVGKKPSGRSMPKLKDDGFYHCSTTKNVIKHSITDINGMDKQSWWSTFQLTSDKLSYARIFVGYDNLDDPSEYTIYVKHVVLEDNAETRRILKKYGKNVASDSASETSSGNSVSSDDDIEDI